jgi:hypothetical protein
MAECTAKPLEQLSDRELLDRERSDRGAYFQLHRVEAHRLGTTYRVIHASSAHLTAWQRWLDSSCALRERGITPRSRKRDSKPGA